jgi:PIN domain nuclease of toxin-antitoxin system
MPALLDTHAFLWWCEDASELSRKARQAISGEECFVSHASIWEIAIKSSSGKLTLPAPVEKYVTGQMSLNGFGQLEIGFRHITRTCDLPWHHRDPFDRLLAAQAMAEDLAIISRDSVFERYGIKRIW